MRNLFFISALFLTASAEFVSMPIAEWHQLPAVPYYSSLKATADDLVFVSSTAADGEGDLEIDPPPQSGDRYVILKHGAACLSSASRVSVMLIQGEPAHDLLRYRQLDVCSCFGTDTGTVLVSCISPNLVASHTKKTLVVKDLDSLSMERGSHQSADLDQEEDVLESKSKNPAASPSLRRRHQPKPTMDPSMLHGYRQIGPHEPYTKQKSFIFAHEVEDLDDSSTDEQERSRRKIRFSA